MADYPHGPPQHYPYPPPAQPAKPRSQPLPTFLGWPVLWLILVVMGFPNLYIIAGLDLPESLDAPWKLGTMFGIYGLGLIAPIVALLLALRGARWYTQLGILSVPLVMQVLAIIGYSYLGDRYGYVCC